MTKPHFMQPDNFLPSDGGYKGDWAADVVELCTELNDPGDVPGEKALMALNKATLCCLVRALQARAAKATGDDT